MDKARKSPTVVSNTSPITNLTAIGRLDLLQKLFTHLHISQAVEEELFFGGQAWPGGQETKDAPWVEIHQVYDRHTVDALRLDLDAGESETIALPFSWRQILCWSTSRRDVGRQDISALT